jgi:hypothetical protein
MRWSLLGVRLSIITVYVVIAAIIVMSVLPLATGKLQVSVPEGGDNEPVMDGSKVVMTIPVDIINDGYFDIQDLTVKFRIADGANVLTEYSSVPVDVVAGRVNHLNLSVVMDLDYIDESDLKDLVFNATTLDLEVGVEAGYSLGLVKAAISTEQEIEWEPLVSDVQIDTGNVNWETNGTSMDVLVPYSFKASDFAQGKTVGMYAEISNSTAVMGTASESFTISSYNEGQLRFTVPMETFLWLQSHPETLGLGVDLSLMGATMHMDTSIQTGGYA